MSPDEILSRRNGKKVVALFGEILADIFPERSVLGGAPFNVARHLQAFGMHPVMISRTGNDALREDLMREMLRLGMDTSGIQCDPVYPTGQVQVHIENGQHRFEILPDQAYDHIHAGMTHMMTMSLKPSLVYFGTLAQRAIESRLALDKFIADSHCPKFLDINLRSPWFSKHTIRRSLQRANIVKMNQDELADVARFFRIEGDSPEAQALQLMQAFDLKALLLTCGEQGAWLIDSNNEIFSTGPAEPEGKLIDTVGAGDAFAAIFIVGLLNQWPTALTLQRANRFAAALCGIRGGAPDDDNFYAPFLKEWKA